MYFEFRKSQGIREEILARIPDVCGVLETKRSGMELFLTPEGTCDSTANQMVERFKDTGHPVLKSISALIRGILQKNGRDTLPFNADPRTQSSVQIMQSDGAVTN